MQVEKVKEDIEKLYPNANSIIIYGSALYKESHNDIDILIIDDTQEYAQLQIEEYDILVSSKQDFKNNIMKNNPLFQSILFNFKILKDNNNIFKSNMRRYYYFLRNNPSSIYNTRLNSTKSSMKNNLNKLQFCF